MTDLEQIEERQAKDHVHYDSDDLRDAYLDGWGDAMADVVKLARALDEIVGIQEGLKRRIFAERTLKEVANGWRQKESDLEIHEETCMWLRGGSCDC